MRLLNESTAVSVGLMVVLLGGVFWLSSLYSLASQTEARTSKIEQKQDVYTADVHQIKQDIAVIKEMLKKSN